jgi:hypothetical protein
MTAILVTSGVNYRFLRVPIFLAKIVIIGNFFDKFFLSLNKFLWIFLSYYRWNLT